jgi:hypothetical protein
MRQGACVALHTCGSARACVRACVRAGRHLRRRLGHTAVAVPAPAPRHPRRAQLHGRMLHCRAAVLRCCCAAVLLCCGAAVLPCCCAAVLLCCRAAVLPAPSAARGMGAARAARTSSTALLPLQPWRKAPRPCRGPAPRITEGSRATARVSTGSARVGPGQRARVRALRQPCVTTRGPGPARRHLGFRNRLPPHQCCRAAVLQPFFAALRTPPFPPRTASAFPA